MAPIICAIHSHFNLQNKSQSHKIFAKRTVKEVTRQIWELNPSLDEHIVRRLFTEVTSEQPKRVVHNIFTTGSTQLCDVTGVPIQSLHSVVIKRPLPVYLPTQSTSAF